MKQVAFAGALCATLLAAMTASAAGKTNFTVKLSWTQENFTPTVGAHDPGGTANVTYDETTKHLCGTVTWTDLTGPPTGIHLHQTPDGMETADGSVKLIIPPPPAGATSVTFNFTLDASFEKSLMAPTSGNTELYFNIHTAMNPGTPAGTPAEARSFTPWDNGTTEVPCPAPTNPDGGVSTSSSSGDSGIPTPVPTTTSTFGTTSGTQVGSSGTTGSTTPGTTSGSGTTSGDAAPEKKSGCSTTGSPANALSLAFVVGIGIAAATGRLRRRSKR